MQISNSDMAKLMLPAKIKKFEEKIKNGTVTFDDCGLDAEKNFLDPCDDVLIDDDEELERYCMNLCAICPMNRCAVFLIYNDHRVSCVVELGFDDFDTFCLDDSWHCWNFISIEDNFGLPAYGILCETQPGRWKTITE